MWYFFFNFYELDSCPQDLNYDFTLKNWSFGGAKLTKNANPDKYSHSGYGIGFDTRIEFSLPDSSICKNGITFELIWARLCILIIKEKIS